MCMRDSGTDSPNDAPSRSDEVRSPPDIISGPVIALFACASGLSVANVYYAQPLLDTLAIDFSISRGAVGGVITALQAGSVLALFLLVPLGDRFDRRRLMMMQLLALVGALGGVAFATSGVALMAGMLAVGLLGTAMTQGLIAYAAVFALPAERGRVVGIVQSGVVTGLLLARVLAGGIADIAGWRGVYCFSAGIMLVLALLLWFVLPKQGRAAQTPRLSYAALIMSMVDLLRNDRVLQTRGLIALLMFAVFNIFWATLVLPLSAPPYLFSHTRIGAFGLVGMIGVLAAARAGRWADRGLGQRVSAVALLLLLVSWVPLWFTMHTLWALIVGIILLDMAVQALHVINQSMILRRHTEAPSRIIGCYMLFYAAGSGLGALGSTAVYALAGWSGVCILGASVSLLALGVWGWTLCYMPESCPTQGE